MMDNTLRWYAVYTRSRHEKKIATRLVDEGIEAYVPLKRFIRQWSDRRKLVLEPAIRSYVFVRINNKTYYNVLNVEGVVRYIFFEGKPAVIPDKEIDALKKVMDNDIEIECVHDNLSQGMKVRIIKGPLAGIEGELVQLMGKHKVALRIEAIQQVIMMTISKTMLEPVKSSDTMLIY